MVKVNFVSAVVAAVLVIVFGLSGGTAAFGAHPWWAQNVAYIGAGIGFALALFAAMIGLDKRGNLVIGGLALIATGYTAWLGKSRFAASFTEDAFAGQLWFYGWIGAMSALCFLLYGLTSLVLSRR